MGDLPLLKGNSRTQKGRYRVKNLKKYVGDPTRVYFRSGWELKFCNWCDTSPQVVAWGSEVVKVLYRLPNDKKGRVRTYYVDFAIRAKKRGGGFINLLIELKPSNQLSPSKKAKMDRRRMMYELKNYIKIAAKQEYAIQHAKRVGMEYQIWNEKDLKRFGII